MLMLTLENNNTRCCRAIYPKVRILGNFCMTRKPGILFGEKFSGVCAYFLGCDISEPGALGWLKTRLPDLKPRLTSIEAIVSP